MTSAIITQIWKLLPSSWMATSQTGVQTSTSCTASLTHLPEPEQSLHRNVNLHGSCTESNEHLSYPDAIYNSLLHNSLAASTRVLFEHQPLDHYQPTIRLVTVSPDLSTEGYIQCFIHRTTTDARYTCLSYTWGEPEPKQHILINGRQFLVRKNLLDFLENIRGFSKYRNTGYWIDALCINQSNVAERNHQVAQMGLIYSKAVRVIAWLGISDSEIQERTHWEWIAQNEYWSRAWITQELVLARQVIVMIGLTTFGLRRTFSLEDIWSYLNQNNISIKESRLNNFHVRFGTITELIGRPLTELLLRFYDRKCSVARDQIFSLVSLCSEKDRIKVDYESSIFQLAHQVVDACHSTICICTTMLILDRLDADIYQLSSNELAHLMADGPYLEFELHPQRNKFYANENVNHESCTLLGQIIKDPAFDHSAKPVEEHENIHRGFSWSRHMNHRWAQKFRLSFVRAWIWYKQQDKSQGANIEERLDIRRGSLREQRLEILVESQIEQVTASQLGRIDGLRGPRPRSVSESGGLNDMRPRLGWGNSNMYAN